MDTTLRHFYTTVALSFSLLLLGCNAMAEQEGPVKYSQSMTDKYSQKVLLKNWAMSVCLAKIATDKTARADANATASAYLEYGKQPIEAYDALRELALKFAARKYGGSIKSEFNTMKCIDLYNSKELDELATKISKGN